MTRCPTKAAARCKLDSVMSHFGSRMRSTCERLVFSKTAMRAVEIFFFVMAFASCQATTSLMACACASAKMFSFVRKSSTLDPRFFLLMVLGRSVPQKVHSHGTESLTCIYQLCIVYIQGTRQSYMAVTMTSIRLDTDLADEAKKVLRVKSRTEAVHVALREIVALKRFKALMKKNSGKLKFSGLDE